MRVLFIEPCHVGFGGYFRAINLCTALSKQNVQVDLLCASGKKFYFGIRKTKINDYLIRYELPRFYLHFFINGRVLRGMIGLCFGLFKRYDIIHAAVPTQLESNIPAFFLKLLGKKVVMDWDDYWEETPSFTTKKILKSYLAFCERKAPAFFKNFVVVSDILYKLAVQRGATNVIKVINGIGSPHLKMFPKNEARQKLKLKIDEKYLLAFGNTYPKDRTYLLFKTFEYILEQDPTVKLFVNFDHTKQIDEFDLRSQIKSSTLQNVTSLGFIPQKDLELYLSACDASIFLLGETINERACFPIRLGTYLDGESITIINDTDSEATNILKKYNCAIIHKDIKELANKTIQYLHDESLQKQMKTNIQKAKSDLGWNHLVTEIIAYYKKIL